ncbi:MAG: SpoIIE family protein phosphatase, partial [Micromonosporaceae bacterium]
MAWSESLRFTGQTRRYLLALAESCSRAVAQIQHRGSSDPTAPDAVTTDGMPQLAVAHNLVYGLLPMALEPLYDPAALLAPIRDGDRIVDFEFELANPVAHKMAEAEQVDLRNSTLLEVFPEVGSRLLLREYSKVLRTGKSYQIGDLHIAAEEEGTRDSYTFAMHAVRFADRVLVVWRLRTDADLLHDQLLHAERLAKAGSFWWNVRAGDMRWSPGMHRLFSRTPEQGAIPLHELSSYVHGDDWVGVQNAISRLMEGHEASLEFRLTGHGAGRRLRLRAEPVSDRRHPENPGELYAVRGTVRDVTEERAAEARLRVAEEALGAQRARLEAEQRAATSLRDAVLPTAPELATATGLSLRGLCRSPEQAGRVAGDWYDVVPLSGSRTLLVVGDVAGKGLSATTAAAQLRSAVRAYAVLEMPPAELLNAVNRMMCELATDQIATLAVAEYQPDEHKLRWAVAGHAAPLRFPPDGLGERLTDSVGVPIGALTHASYQTGERVMSPGDRVLLYTDGLITRRGTPADDGLDVLLQTGSHVDLDDVDAVANHLTVKLGAEPHDDLCLISARVLEVPRTAKSGRA